MSTQKLKITNYQLIFLAEGLFFGSAPIVIATNVTLFAGRDAWISVMLAVIIGFVFIWLNSYLGGSYPDKTFVEITQLLLGKWLGSIVSVFFILLAFIFAAQIIWYSGDYFTTAYMHETSTYPINIIFITAIVIAVFYGLEALCRAREILFMVLFVLFIISMAMLIPNIEINYLLPVLENGIAPVLKGTLPMIGFTILPGIFLNMIYPVNINNIKDAKKSLYKGYFLGMLIIFISVFMCILVLGSTITSNYRFPLYELTKEINLGTIISRLEALITITWLFAIFTAAFVNFYAVVIGLSQILKLKDYKKIVIPLALILTVYTGYIYKNVPAQIEWDLYVRIPVMFTFGFVLPLILLFIHLIKKSFGKKSC